MKTARSSQLTSVVAIAVLALIHLATLRHFPAPFPDDASNGASAKAMLKTHQPISALDSAASLLDDHYSPLTSWLASSAQAAGVASVGFGTVDIFSARISNLVFGFLLLGSIAALGRRLFPDTSPTMVLLCVGLSPVFFVGAHWARTEVFAAALGFAGMALLLRISNAALACLTGGVLAGLAFCFHLRGVIYLPLSGLLLLCYRRDALLHWRSVVSAALGYGLGLFPFLLLQLHFDLPRFYHYLGAALPASRLPPATDGTLLRLPQIFLGTLQTLRWIYGPCVILVLAAPILFWRNRDTAGLRFAGFAFAAYCCFVLVVKNPGYEHFILITPLLELAFARALSGVCGAWQKPWSSLPMRCVCAVCIAATVLGGYLLPMRATWACETELQESLAFVHDSWHGEHTLVGGHLSWLAFQDEPVEYRSWDALPLLMRKREAPLSSVIDSLHPDLLVVDQHVRAFIQDEPSPNAWFEDLRISKTDFDRLLAEKMRLRASREFRCLGTIAVYESVRASG